MKTLDFKEDSFIYSNKEGLLKVSYEDVLMVESDKPFVCFYLKERKFLVQCSLESVLMVLKEYFVQVNRQVVVNMKYVNRIICQQDSYWVCIENEKMYRVSFRRKKDVFKIFSLYG